MLSEMRQQVFERHLFAHANGQRELAVKFRGLAFAAAPTPMGATVIGTRPTPAATVRWRAVPVISVCGEKLLCGNTSSAGRSCGR